PASGIECDTTDNVKEGNFNFTVAVAAEAGNPQVALVVQTADGCVKEDTQTPVLLTAATADATDQLTSVTVTGLTGWSVDLGALNTALAGTGTATFVNGVLTITFTASVQNFSQVVQMTPPADTDVDAPVTVTAHAQDITDHTVTSSASVNPTLMVD